MRVLVTGGRGYTNKEQVRETLDGLENITLLIEGGCTGADNTSRIWALNKGVPTATYYPAWEKFGRAAGPIRNEWMIKFGQPDLAVVFPGGKGTASMLELIKKAGIDHIIVV